MDGVHIKEGPENLARIFTVRQRFFGNVHDTEQKLKIQAPALNTEPYLQQITSTFHPNNQVSR
jgi:hypothetical protein